MGKFPDYFIIFLFIAISGNPFFCYWSWGAVLILLAFVTLLIIRRQMFFLWDVPKNLKKYLLAFCMLFVLQIILCSDISIATQINYLIKIFTAGLLYTYWGKKFKYLYLNVITFIAIISLLLYPLVMFGFTFGSPLGTGFSTSSSLHTLIFYNYDTEFNPDRNAGMFWEPGCYACYLCLTPLFFINNPKELLNTNRLKALILLMALFSTRSTTGYVVLGVIMLFIFIRSWSSAAIALVLGLIVMFSLSDVIIDKLNRDAETVDGMTLGESTKYDGYNTENRLGTIYFLAPIILQHPIIGNGLNPEAMFSTMKEVLVLDHVGLGNGFFTYWTSLGLLGIFIFLGGIFMFWKIPLKQRMISIVILVLLLQGEPLLIYPLVMGFPFLRH